MEVNFDDDFNYGGYFMQCSTFLSENKWIFEHSNTKFVQAGVLDQFPRTWINDLNCATTEEINQVPLGYINISWSDDFKQFLQTLSSLSVTFARNNYFDGKPASLKGVNIKKLYEIENLTALIGQVCCQDEILLDFGSGLGYLSQNLHIRHGLTILGVEGDAYRVQASHQRQSQIFPGSSHNVKFVEHFIEEKSFDFLKTTSESVFSQTKSKKFAIVGLHACADLSITAIKMFLSNESVTKLVIMPCCYHKLKPRNESFTSFYNIPLSSALTEVLANLPNFLSRPFLRLGCQQTAARWRDMTEKEHDAHGRAMFERSLTEAVLSDGEFVTANKVNGEIDGSGGCLKRYLLHRQSEQKWSIPWTEEHYKKEEDIGKHYPNGSQLAEFLTCIQTCLQSICENLILLDRMCFIETEAAGRNIRIRRRLVKLANDRLSPRCFVIIAEKIK